MFVCVYYKNKEGYWIDEMEPEKISSKKLHGAKMFATQYSRNRGLKPMDKKWCHIITSIRQPYAWRRFTTKSNQERLVVITRKNTL